MHEQECKVIWSLRHELINLVPTLLPKLLDCVEWNDHREVAQVMSLIRLWPQLPVEKALELLDYAYADQAVRSFAVRCLANVKYVRYFCFLNDSFYCGGLLKLVSILALLSALNLSKLNSFI